MSTPVVANVLKTGASVYNAPYGEPVPNKHTIGFGVAWGGNWVSVGYTSSPLVANYKSDEFDMEVEEELSAINRKRVKESLMLETTLAELTASYLALASGNQSAVALTSSGSATVASEYYPMGGVTYMPASAWGFEAEYVDANGASFPVRCFVHKATAMINGNLSFSRKDNNIVGIPLQVKALCNTSGSAGNQLWAFERVTATTT